MSEEQRSTSQAKDAPSLAECIEAGLYYFARDDFDEARRWWDQALSIDPHNSRVQECLRILERAGQKAAPAPLELDPQLGVDPFAATGEEVPFDPFKESFSPQAAASGPDPPAQDALSLPAPAPRLEVPTADSLFAGLGSLEPPASSALSLSDPPRPDAHGASASEPDAEEPSLLEVWSRPSMVPGPAPPLESLEPFSGGGWQGFDPGAQLQIDGGIATDAQPFDRSSRASLPPPPSSSPSLPAADGAVGALSEDAWNAAIDEYVSSQTLPRSPLVPAPDVETLKPGQSVQIEPDQILFTDWGAEAPGSAPDIPVPIEPPRPIRSAPPGDRVPSARAPVPLRHIDLDDGPTPEELIGEVPLVPRGIGAIESPSLSADADRDDIRRAVEAFSLEAFDSGDSERELIPIEAPQEAPLTTPWDFGPAETTAVTLEQSQEDDALAEKTPMPILDRAPLFQPEAARVVAETFPDVPPRTPDLFRRGLLAVDRPEASSEAPVADAGDAADAADAAENLRRAADRLQLHDFDGALELLERIPSSAPEHEAALDMLAQTRRHLEQAYTSKIGPLEAAPRVLLPPEELIWLNLNHRAGFLLSQVDGNVSYEDLIALSGMPRLDTLRILCSLLQEGVIGTD
ncbi:MAG: tetratricopeptide repeat protein [Deltaproteobacteria bacterium]|nr:tetratricopeptide repeat protein [Deltaproteobacteria bacterium]